ncbi:MAG: potassium transporter [Rhodothermales bacterium]|nr:potassium transporter [Rhodothermales bacterium]
MSGGFLFQAFVFLAAAVISVPIAKRFGLGSVLGYLLAGIAIGPFGLELLGQEGEDLMHFAEFGVVLMLFVIGLELEPSLLWKMRTSILGLGGLQVLITTMLVFGIALAAGLAWMQALAVGMTVALSSTAIVLQTMDEKGWMSMEGGQGAFSVLLFQDIAVIPMLAVFPLLSSGSGGHEIGADAHGATTFIQTLPAWLQTVAVVGSVALIVLGGRTVLRPVFRVIARTRLRELFTAAALLLVIGIALLMSQVGLSSALGTFLAGVVLANSEYRHELESDIEPFKGLLLGLFFIAVGASIDFQLVGSSLGLIAAIVAGVLLVKGVVLFILSRSFGIGTDQALLMAFALPQMGEFAFVLFSFANQEGVLSRTITDPLVAAVAISMAATPLLILVYERLLRPRLGTRTAEADEPDAIEESNPVLIAGFGAFGSTVGRLLSARGVESTVLENDSDRVELLRRLGLKVYYGDATRHDLLETAGAGDARILIVAVDTPERTLRIARTARKHFPGLTIMARAFDWGDAHDLLEAGVDRVFRESLDTALRTGEEALQTLGYRAYESHRVARRFRRHDERNLHELTGLRAESRDRYISEARRRIADLEDVLRTDLTETDVARDAAWDDETLREEFGPDSKRPE